jgi:hypothetical protein
MRRTRAALLFSPRMPPSGPLVKLLLSLALLPCTATMLISVVARHHRRRAARMGMCFQVDPDRKRRDAGSSAETGN